jgi:flagellar basal-body rod protein FlgB
MNDSMLQLLQGYMQVATERQQTIAANMANVDTPGYQTRDINFQQAMQDVMDRSGTMELVPATEEVEGLPERPDGNNVNVDRDSMLMSETQLQYQMGVQLIKSEFHTWYTAIKD